MSPADHLAVRIISGLADQLCLQLEIFLLGENGVFVNINIALASPDDVGYWVSAVRTPDWALYVNHRVRGMWIRALYVINRFPQEPPLMSAANNLWEVLDMSLARGCRIVYLISQTYLHYQQSAGLGLTSLVSCTTASKLRPDCCQCSLQVNITQSSRTLLSRTDRSGQGQAGNQF